MSMHAIGAGRDVPNDVNVIIEIPAQSSPVKYEIGKETSALWVDRILSTPMFYPANYGFIPHTLCDDGDPMDVMVITPYPLIHASVIRVRPIGVLGMTDESGDDHKILAVPITPICPLYDQVKNYQDIPKAHLDSIEHFFGHYKDLCPGKWVELKGWQDAKSAKQDIINSVALFLRIGGLRT